MSSLAFLVWIASLLSCQNVYFLSRSLPPVFTVYHDRLTEQRVPVGHSLSSCGCLPNEASHLDESHLGAALWSFICVSRENLK